MKKVMSFIIASSIVFAQLSGTAVYASTEVEDNEIELSTDEGQGIGELINSDISTYLNEALNTSINDLNYTSEVTEVDSEVIVSDIQKKSSSDEYLIDEVVDITRKKTVSRNPNAKSMINIDPNNALYIPPDFYNVWLGDYADANDRWYVFEVPEESKINVDLNQQGSGDYDIYLYKYNSGSLDLVDYSYNEGGSEKIDYIGDGVYYLRINPYIPSTETYVYGVLVNIIENYDSYEINDDFSEASGFTNEINVTGTIDNTFDEDWYKINTEKAGNYTFTTLDMLANDYAVFIYDNKLNSISGYITTNKNTIKRYNLDANKDYYVRILSYTGNFDDTPYNLLVHNSDNRDTATLATGHVIEYDNNNLYINGKKAQISGEYSSYASSSNLYPIYERANENIKAFDNTLSVIPAAYQLEYYKDGSRWQTAQVIPVLISNGWYNGVYSSNSYGYNSFYWDTDPNRVHVGTAEGDIDGDLLVYVDINTGKVVDTPYSMHYTTTIFPFSFKTPTLIF